MKRFFLSATVICILFNNIVAMDSKQHISSIENRVEMRIYNNVTLKNIDLEYISKLNVSSLYIEKNTCGFFYAIASLLKNSIICGSTFSINFNNNIINSKDFIEVPIGDGLYLSAVSKIFSGEKVKVDDESLNEILSAAEQGSKDAQETIKLACYDYSYMEAIGKGIDRVKKCLESRILGKQYGLDFYRPLAIDFPLMIASHSDWSVPFQHISSVLSFLKEFGNTDYAYAAVQDICCMYQTLKEQCGIHSSNERFKNNIVDFLFVASLMFKKLNNNDLYSGFLQLSQNIKSSGLKVIDGFDNLFSKAINFLASCDE